jgi:hypothetical protein
MGIRAAACHVCVVDSLSGARCSMFAAPPLAGGARSSSNRDGEEQEDRHLGPSGQPVGEKRKNKKKDSRGTTEREKERALH